jgi:hypothetical protein
VGVAGRTSPPFRVTPSGCIPVHSRSGTPRRLIVTVYAGVMSSAGEPAPSRLRSEPIIVPNLPVEMVERLRSAFRSIPRVVEAWALGFRLVPLDDTSPYDATLIGLKLDPPLDSRSRDASRNDFVALADELRNVSGFGHERDQGWQIFDQAAADEHPGHAALIYSSESGARAS